MATKKKGQGLVVVGPGRIIEAVPSSAVAAMPRVPAGLTWLRTDTPFTGDGQRVELRREAGYTPPRYLGVPFRFQLPPTDPITRSGSFSWSNFDVLDEDDGAAERTRPGGKRLRTVSISSAFLSWNPTWEVWHPQLADPIMATRELEQLRDHGVRFRLRIRNPRLYEHDDVNMLAVITSATVTEQPSEPDTRYIALEFQEYEPTEVERKAIHNEVGPWTHTIRDGDTLYKLAKRYHHRQSAWRLIARDSKNGNLEHQAPSHNLIGWSKKHKRKTIRIPKRADANVPVAA